MMAFILLSYNNTNEKIWKVWGREEVFRSPALNMENTETIELLSAVRKLHLSFIVERFIATVSIKLILIDHADQTLTKYNLTQQFLTPLHQRPIGFTRNEAAMWGCLLVFGVAAALSSCLFLTFWTRAGSEGLTHEERNWGVKESRMYNLGSDRGRKDKL